MASWLLPDEPVANSENKVANKVATKSNRRVLGFVVLAGLMASSGAIIEGVAQDWSALYLKDVQNVSVALAAWGLAAFNIGMILGRIFIDRIVEQRGRGFVIRWGALFSAVAIGLQAIAPSFELSLFFWFLLGLGVSGVVPQLIAASGEIGEASHSGRNMAKVAGITYVGGLAGPSIIGLLTRSLPLEVAIGWGSLLGIFIVLSYSQLQKLPK
jgi:MFS family permease